MTENDDTNSPQWSPYTPTRVVYKYDSTNNVWELKSTIDQE